MPLSSFLRYYEGFIKDHGPEVLNFEKSVRSFTYLLPGKFEDAELASEAIYSALNLLGLYHDAILTDVKKPTGPETDISRHQRLFNAYFGAWSSKDALFRRASALLTLLQYTEVLLEMLATRHGNGRSHTHVALSIEVVKAAARLALLDRTHGRMLLQPPHFERDLSGLQEQSEALDGEEAPAAEASWKGPRTQQTIPLLSEVQGEGKGGVYGYLARKIVRPESIMDGKFLVSTLHGGAHMAEVLFILRPVLYVLALRRWGNRSWIPWLASLTLEGLSVYGQRRVGEVKKSGGLGAEELSEGERNRRRRLLLLYLLRGPFFQKYTKPRIDGLCSRLEGIPLLSILAGILRGYEPLWEKLYFYTAGSS